MNRRSLVFAAAFLCLGALFFILLLQGPADPVYQSKPLSHWLKLATDARTRGEPGTVAVEHYGAEAEPMLNALLRAHDSKIGLLLQQVLAKQNLIKFKFEPAGALNARGFNGCSILGSKVSGCVPALVELMHRHKPNSGLPDHFMPMATLAVMGPKGIEALVGELESPDRGVRSYAAQLLGTAPDANTPRVSAALRGAIQKGRSAGDTHFSATAAHSLELAEERGRQRISASATNWLETTETDAGLLNIWDANQGSIRILAASETQKNLGNSSLLDLFGARQSRFFTGETGCTIFDNNSDGFTHYVEWETTKPVTLRSFGFIAMHDSFLGSFQRALRTIRLFARSGPGEEFKPVYAEELTVPYGAGEHHSMLFLFRNLETPVTASQFRVEFVQHGTGMYNGPRVTQLYGFGSQLNWPIISTAIANQPAQFQVEIKRYFGKE